MALFKLHLVRSLLLFASIRAQHLSVPAPEKVQASGYVFRDYVFVSTLNGTLYAVDSVTGNVHTVIQQPPILKNSVRSLNSLGFLADPQHGSLYQINNGKFRKLPLTISTLVQTSPSRSSDGLLYSGSKQDSWISLALDSNGSIYAYSLAYGSSVTCPASGRTVWIGRSEYEIRMVDTKDQTKQSNITFLQYAAGKLPVQPDYEYDYYSSCSDGLLVTVHSATGQVVWKNMFDSVVVALYQLHSSGFQRLDQRVMGKETLYDMLQRRSTSSNQVPFLDSAGTLFPSIFIGKHGDAVYAMHSMVNSKTVLFSLEKRELLMLEGPTAKGEKLQNHTNDNNKEQSTLQPKITQQFLMGESGQQVDGAPSIFGYHEVPPVIDSTLYIAFPSQVLPSVPRIGYLNNEQEWNASRSTSGWPFWSLFNQMAKFVWTILFAVFLTLVFALRIMKWRLVSLRKFSLLNNHANSSNGCSMSVGRIEFNPYDVLGRGSDGTVVYKGFYDARPAAVKRVVKDFSIVADREVGLLRESDFHPNVVRYFCTEVDEQFCYIALQLCRYTVQDYVEDPTIRVSFQLDPKQLLMDTTQGLAHLHKLGIVHRDVKPQNVLISCTSAGPVAMLSDFGLGRQVHSKKTSCHSTSVVGTEGWIAPEVLQGKAFTLASDIFSLGCLYYYVINDGKHPFGDRPFQQCNILLGNTAERFLPCSAEASHLVFAMIGADQSSRPSAQRAIRHPFFWSIRKRLSFLQDVSDRVDKAGQDSPIVRRLEAGAYSVVGGSWKNTICDALREDLGRFRTYRGRSICDLLRALRNKRHHYHELPEQLRQSLGTVPNQFLAYFTGRFPLLLMHVYNACDDLLRDEHLFNSYYA